MRIHAMRDISLRTFSGAHADQRFGRDDISGDFILRERDLHNHIPVPMRLMNDDTLIDQLPEDGDDDREDGRDDFFPRPKTLNYGY